MARETWKPGNMLNPVPAVMVSCQRPGEKPNIITIAWAGTVCSDPAMLSISVRPERYSYNIIKETGEFVVNLVSRELIRACDWCGVRSGREYDKFAETGLSAIPSQKISAPTIAESPISLECKVKETVPLGSHDLFIAEIMCVTVDDRYMDETGRFSMENANLTTYCHGKYFGLGEYLGKFGYSVEKKKAGKKK